MTSRPSVLPSIELNHQTTDFSLTINPGENLGVTGPSGCGKSSLALLLTRMYALTGGRILLDGHDVRELDSTFLRTTVRLRLRCLLLSFGWLGLTSMMTTTE